MSIEGEVVGLERGGLIEDPVVEQDRAEDGALGFEAGGKSAFETVVEWWPWESDMKLAFACKNPEAGLTMIL